LHSCFYNTISKSNLHKSECFYHSCNNPNVAVETTIGQKSTINFDVLASFWKSINGKPRQFYTLHQNTDIISSYWSRILCWWTHWSYYISFSKWNYLNTDLYEKDMDTLLAQLLVTKQKINDKFQLDCFLGGGWHQGFTRDTV
jgi:hypothetical protein